MNLRVATWNVNSCASRLERLKQFLIRHSPDYVCLQELKCIEENFPFDSVKASGYGAIVSGQKTYNGVAILFKKEPAETVRLLGADGFDSEARFILGKFPGLTLASCYIPNGGEVGSEKYRFKLGWLSALRTFLDKNVDAKAPILLGGDFNVAPESRDAHDPVKWEGKILFSEPEKRALAELKGFGLKDLYRGLNKKTGAFTWWDYREGAFNRNFGMRIDFLLGTESVARACRRCWIDSDERKGEKPSDHAPVLADLEF